MEVGSKVFRPLTTSRPRASTTPAATGYRCLGAIMVLLWNIIVGTTHGVIIYVPIVIVLYQTRILSSSLWVALLTYCALGLLQMLYPIGGLLADIRCGRYKMIFLSLLSIWLGCACLGVLGIFYGLESYIGRTGIVQGVSGMLALVIFLIGYSGYQANAVQFGLDQLPDASSETLSLYLHWFVWAETVGETFTRILVTSNPCSKTMKKIEGFSSVVFLSVVTLCLAFSWHQRHRLHSEEIASNPYRNVYRVLKFALRHKQPQGRRSALTFSDDYQPRRIDFAKQIYGGPFPTEVVEDVKTFVRLIAMLLTVSTVFSFEVATVYLFPIFGRHLGRNGAIHDMCTYKWILFESGTLSDFLPVLGVPTYVVLVYPRVKRWIPRILHRLGVGLALKMASVVSIFVIQVSANYNAAHSNSAAANFTCAFLSAYHHTPLLHGNITNPVELTLGLPSQILGVPNLLTGIATPLIGITTLEFISAQSPHTMKGVLLGIFYAFKGLFIMLGCVIAIPFVQESLWDNVQGVFDCGFYYYLCNAVLSLAGMALFVIVARWYRYRARDDPPYEHRYAEEYYSRLLEAEPARDYGSAQQSQHAQ